MTEPLEPTDIPVTELTPPVATTKPIKKQSRGGTILLTAAGLVAVAGIAFAAGRLTAPAAAAGGTSDTGGFRNFPTGSFTPGQFRGPGGGTGGGFGGLTGGIQLQGQVTAVSSTSITVKLENGTEVTVPLDSSTKYHESTASSSSAVTVGSTVSVQPGTGNFAPGASPNPQASGAPGPGQLTFGPATDVTVVSGAASSAAPQASAAP